MALRRSRVRIPLGPPEKASNKGAFLLSPTVQMGARLNGNNRDNYYIY